MKRQKASASAHDLPGAFRRPSEPVTLQWVMQADRLRCRLAARRKAMDCEAQPHAITYL